MRTHPIDHAAALRIECPYCYAPVGRNCVSLANAAMPARAIHRVRIHHGWADRQRAIIAGALRPDGSERS